MTSKIESAIGIIDNALRLSERPYVACSFGKDSSVLLHLVLQRCSTIDVAFVRYHETEMIDNYQEVIEAWNLTNLHQLFVEDDILSNTSEAGALDKWALENGYDCAFVGLRAEESKGRRITLRKDGLIFKRKNGMYRCCPIGFWTTKDIEAYVVSKRLPTLDTYKRAGFSSRTVSSLTLEDFGFREQQLRQLRHRDPARYNALLKKYPELCRYA